MIAAKINLHRVLQPSARRCVTPRATLDYKKPVPARPLQESAAQQEPTQKLAQFGPLLSDAGRNTPRLDEQEYQLVLSTAAAERALAASLLGLACVAFDVFSPISQHLLLAVDSSAHEWVMDNVPASVRAFAAQHVLSDAATTLGLLGWAGAAVYAAMAPGNNRGDRTSQALLLAVAGYTAGGAFTEWRGGDGMVVVFLKHLFHRARPSHEFHSTYSFPSGHTTAAVFIVGTLLMLLLPVAFEEERQWRQQQQRRRQQRQQLVTLSGDRRGLALHHANGSHISAVQERSAAVGSSPAGAPAGDAHLAPWQEALLSRRVALWAGAALLTASGRVLANAHWFSDTLAGMCLGCALVSATILIWNWLAPIESEREWQ